MNCRIWSLNSGFDKGSSSCLLDVFWAWWSHISGERQMFFVFFPIRLQLARRFRRESHSTLSFTTFIMVMYQCLRRIHCILYTFFNSDLYLCNFFLIFYFLYLVNVGLMVAKRLFQSYSLLLISERAKGLFWSDNEWLSMPCGWGFDPVTTVIIKYVVG